MLTFSTPINAPGLQELYVVDESVHYNFADNFPELRRLWIFRMVVTSTRLPSVLAKFPLLEALSAPRDIPTPALVDILSRRVGDEGDAPFTTCSNLRRWVCNRCDKELAERLIRIRGERFAISSRFRRWSPEMIRRNPDNTVRITVEEIIWCTGTAVPWLWLDPKRGWR